MKYIPKLKLYSHQAECVQKMQGMPAFAILAQMRTGKSAMILAEWGQNELDGNSSDLLIVAPAGSYRNWAEERPGAPSEITKHLSSDLRERVHSFTWRSGSYDRVKLNALLASVSRPRVLVVNVEALSTVVKAREAVQAFLDRGNATIVIDESTKIRNVKAKRTKFLLDIRKRAPIRRIATGQVAPRCPLDLYAQFYFLNPQILGYWSYITFRRRYAIVREMEVGNWETGRRRTILVDVGYRDVEELQQNIAPYSYRCLLKDCYDLPPKLYVKRDVELTAEQKRIYKGLLEDAQAQLESGDYVSTSAKIVNILRRHQVLCGQVEDEKGGIHRLPENRTKELLEVLDEYDGKAVIWAKYVFNIEDITEALRREYGPNSVAQFWGGNRDTRHIDEARFLTDPTCRFMVSTPAAGGFGNTWTIADLVVYYSNSEDLEHREQSEERTQGIGKERRVTYVDLVVPDTIDEKIIENLRAKIDLSASIMGDGYREWLI